MTTKSMPSALLDFRRARRQAELQSVLAAFRDKPVDLLCYDDVRDKLDGTRAPRGVLKDIELDRIVGSVGRCSDFTRSFLPLKDSDARRWARTEINMSDLAGLPPIEVYELGGVYFVQDGHHRVSVARHAGASYIQAYVTEIHTRASLPPDANADDVIRQAEYSDFLERTQLDELRPDADLTVSVPGQYRKLLEHIDAHRYLMGLEETQPISYSDAVEHWYDHVYLPVERVMRAADILREFPARTQADLYLWIVEHRAELREELGWEVDTAAVVEDLAYRLSGEEQSFLTRVGSALRAAVLPGELERGRPAGEWRERRLSAGQGEQLFRDVAVAVDGETSGWRALRQAWLLSRVEGIVVHGLHVLPPRAEPEAAHRVERVFTRQLETRGLTGELTVRVGKAEEEIPRLARWADLLVLGLGPSPDAVTIARLGSVGRAIIDHASGPLLFVPRDPMPLESAVLAYDGSRKAQEALYVAAYAAEKWGLHLAVVTAHDRLRGPPEALRRACRYLSEHKVAASVVATGGGPVEAILQAVESRAATLIIMGGYGFGPVVEFVLGSTVDRVLRESPVPVLVCR